MMAAVPYLLALPPVILVAAVCLPNGWVNRQSRAFRQWVTLVVGWQFLISGSLAVAYVTGWIPPIHCILFEVSADLPIAATVYYDGVASLMLALVSFVGWVICRYSIRYP